jgi:hypothetical protein
VIAKMMGTKLSGYFKQWQNVNEDYKEKVRTTLSDRIIKAYMTAIRTAFNAWKVNHNGDKIET